MKFILILSLSLICGSIMASGPIGVSITTSACILPSRMVMGAVPWVANHTNAQGDYVKNGQSYYMAITGGTNVETGSGPSGVGQITSGAAVWYSIPQGLRKGYSVVNNSTSRVFLSVGSVAEINKGALLMPNGGSFNDTGSDSVSVIPENGTALITALEW